MSRRLLRPLVALLLVASVLPAVPMAEAQGAANCAAPQFASLPLSGPVYCENFSGSRGTEAWVATAATTSPPGMQWQMDPDGKGDAAAWFGGVRATGGGQTFHGYASVASITLTSPAISLGTHLLTGISFEVKGEAEPTFDFVHLEARSGTGPWSRLISTDGEANPTTYTTKSFAATSLSGLASPVQLRFLFITDTGCDTFDVSCGDPAWPGFWVDNAVLYGMTPPAPPAPQPGPPGNKMPELANLTVPATFNITGNTTKLTLAVNATDEKAVLQVEGYLQRGAELIKVAMTRDLGPTYRGAIDRNDLRLTTGLWAATTVAYDGDGAINRSATVVIDVIASEPGPAPLITLGGNAAPGLQILGAGAGLQFEVASSLLQRVGYRVTFNNLTTFETPLAAPYSLDGRDLPLGESRVTLAVYDRTGRVATLVVTAVRDPDQPLLNVTFPEHVYKGVPFVLSVTVKDASRYAIRLEGGGAPISLADQISGRHQFNLTNSSVGPLPLSVTVTDLAGNRAVSQAVLMVEAVSTDIAVTQMRLGTTPLFVGDAATVQLEVAQPTGVTTLQVRADLMGKGVNLTRTLGVAVAANESLSFVVQLPAGRYLLRATVTPPSGVVENVTGNNVATLQAEVFLGQVTVGNVSYLIRASDAGFPLAAVQDNQTFPLTLDQKSKTDLYRFAANGLNLTWDPAEPVSDQTPPAASTEDNAFVPASGLPLVALALAGLALARRRRA